MAIRHAPPLPALLQWLRDHDVPFRLHQHTPTFTARATARAEGVDPTTFAKTIVVKADDGRRALLVLDATDHLDLRRARRLLNAGGLRLLLEEELAELAPEIDVGTLPPVGLWQMPIYADYGVHADAEISFHAGSHDFAVRVARDAWERATGVIYGDLVADDERGEARPA
ncbi:MAG TPA: YbaK/EbsC family protein [Candidatus Limnocylindria bacterium]